jgi:hypothetical protein
LSLVIRPLQKTNSLRAECPLYKNYWRGLLVICYQTLAKLEQMLGGGIMTGIMPYILPLENGDRITRAEFERRYDAMPHLKKAELIEGIALRCANAPFFACFLAQLKRRYCQKKSNF